MKLEFTSDEAQAIQDAAARLGIAAEDLARGAVLRSIANDSHDFAAAAEYVLTKNEELYKRLS